MSIMGKKIGILIESDLYENKIFYYEHRFAEEGIEVHWLSRLWGQPSLTKSCALTTRSSCQGQRVADASVMPTVVTGNIHTGILMIAEKSADMVKQAHGLHV